MIVHTYDRGEQAVSYRWSLRNNRLKFKTTGQLPIILEEFIEYTPILMKENRTMSTCNRLDLQILGCQLVMPKNLPDYWFIHKLLQEKFHTSTSFTSFTSFSEQKCM